MTNSAGTRWDRDEIRTLRAGLHERLTPEEIGWLLKRSEADVRRMMARLNLKERSDDE